MLGRVFSPDILALYERPGHLRAVLPLNIYYWWGRQMPYECWWYPSPDGHAIAITMIGGFRSKCLLFRW